MFGKRAHETTQDELLDRAGRLFVRAAAGEADEAAAAVEASPFLYSRVRTRIEERRRAESDEGWLAALVVAWRAVPAMAVVAAVAAVLMLWFGIFGAAGATQFSDESLFEARASGGVESVVLADDAGPLSQEEVLDIVVYRGESER